MTISALANSGQSRVQTVTPPLANPLQAQGTPQLELEQLEPFQGFFKTSFNKITVGNMGSGRFMRIYSNYKTMVIQCSVSLIHTLSSNYSDDQKHIAVHGHLVRFAREDSKIIIKRLFTQYLLYKGDSLRFERMAAYLNGNCLLGVYRILENVCSNVLQRKIV